jgi:hypothetical protein
MDSILYYPYINLPRTDWTIRSLLYYESVGSIVPQEYFFDPERNYKPFMLELVRNELVIPIDPMVVLNNAWEVSKIFLEYIERDRRKIKKARTRFLNGEYDYIHSDKIKTVSIDPNKFDENIFYGLMQLGLARMDRGRFYAVEKKTADQLMKFLATIVGSKTNMLPTTNSIKPRFYSPEEITEKRKREIILTELMPFPEEINLIKLMRFKEKHVGLLLAFKTRVENIVLDTNIIEGTELFNAKVRELKILKEELSAKMNENHFKDIIFGTVSGIIGAVYGLSSEPGSSIGPLFGLANAVYSALKIEKAENISDQSGLKYLALVDKRLRGKQKRPELIQP